MCNPFKKIELYFERLVRAVYMLLKLVKFENVSSFFTSVLVDELMYVGAGAPTALDEILKSVPTCD